MCVCVCVMTWCIGAVFCETLCVSPRFTTPYITDFRAVILDADCIATAAELLTPVANAGKKKKTFGEKSSHQEKKPASDRCYRNNRPGRAAAARPP